MKSSKPSGSSGSQKRKRRAQEEEKRKHELTKMKKLSDIFAV